MKTLKNKSEIRCECEVPSCDDGLICENCNLEVIEVEPTAEPKAEELDDIQENTDSMEEKLEAIQDFSPPPPSVIEREWEKEFDEKFEVLVDIIGRYGHVGTKNKIKSFITTLLHSEREKGIAEGMATGRAHYYERVRAEERERIVKMCEEMKLPTHSENGLVMPVKSYNQALSSLRDKLSTL